jgi:small subunit ribosomal protein S1
MNNNELYFSPKSLHSKHSSLQMNENVEETTTPVVEAVVETVTPVVAAPAPVVVAATSNVVEKEEAIELEIPVDEAVTGAAHDAFNWSIGKKAKHAYGVDEFAAYSKQYEESMNQVGDGSIISGKVMAISGGDVVLDVNHKSDGLIPLSEFRDMHDLKVGDSVDVYVEKQEDGRGNLKLSRRKAKLLRAWEAILDSFKNGTVIRGQVISKTKGGLIVDCGGLETFLPGSQIDIKPINDYDGYVGKVMEFKVVKVNEVIKNAVVSHKALIESDLQEQRETIIGGLEKGQVLEGIVKNITDFGAFLDLGGVDGLLYITDISWGRINHPNEVLHNGQRINVVVLDFDDNKKRISLGLKQLTPHPWEVLNAEVGENSIVTGKIVNIEDYGAFLEIHPGVEGLIHVSEITWSNQPVNAREYFKLGQDYSAKVVTIDRDDRKMSLSLKQMTGDPWGDIDAIYPKESRATGEVKNITQYGVFVELREGVGGMVHISDLSWLKRYAHPSEFTKVGQKIDVMILDIDKDGRKLSLGHKQLEENPWDAFEAIFPIGSYHEGKVLRRDDKGAVILLPHGLEAFSPKNHIKKADGALVDAEETLTFKVIEFNRDDKRILVSHTRYNEDMKKEADAANNKANAAEAKEEQAAIKSTQDKVEKTTLGDMDALQALKDQFEKRD